MTENKLRKFISKPREPPSGKRTHQPIILTDSKGNYLKKYACHDVEKQIVWLPKSGAKIEDSTQWLKSNISKKIINYGDIWLYVWIGTCNFTSKNKKYISLKSENDEEVDKIISKYNEIIKIINRYPGTKVTFLETPVYSIKNWNESKGHKDPNIFVEQDENLSKQIYTLNGKVREINKSWHTFTRFFIRSESQRQVPVWKGQETEDQKILQLQTILRRHPSRQPAIKNLVKENIRTGQKRLLGKYQ